MLPMHEPEFRALVKEVVETGRSLLRAEARALVAVVLSAPDPLPEAMGLQLSALLASLAHRGETAEELCGFAEAIRAAGTPLPLTDEERASLVDTCGTGGDGLDTFNISTVAALVAAGAGARVAKHGNRAVTSRCGSADVLEALGAPVALGPLQAAECLRACGFVFLLAPMYHPALRRVLAVRRALPFRTVFNLAGPLSNPAGAAAQLVGVSDEKCVPVMAEALRLLGTRHAWVVHGRVEGLEAGLDELTTTGESVWASVREGAVQSGSLRLESLRLRLASLSELKGGANAGENAALVERTLRGEDFARGEIAVLNAAAALVVAGLAPGLAGGMEEARESLTSGAAMRVLEKLRAFQARY